MTLQDAVQRAHAIRQRGWGKLELPMEDWIDLGLQLRVFHDKPIGESFLLVGVECRPVWQ